MWQTLKYMKYIKGDFKAVIQKREEIEETKNY